MKASGGFSGDNVAMLADKSQKNISVSNLKPGLEIVSGKHSKATIIAVVVITGPVVVCQTATKYGPLLAKWHPIYYKGKWSFTANNMIEDTDEIHFTTYNLVLDSRHAIVLNGILCATLGHEYVGDVIGHEYWGTQKVIDDLSKHPEWGEGKSNIINIQQSDIIRDENTNCIKEIIIRDKPS